MRHRLAGRKLNRTSSHRRALLRTMVTQFLDQERMVTTVVKAKELRPVAERMITLGKRDSLHARRQALSFIRSKNVVAKLFNDLAPRYAQRPGGYTRIVRLGMRKGDGAELALIELLGSEYKPVEPEKRKKKAAKSSEAEKTEPAAPASEAAASKPAGSKEGSKPASRKGKPPSRKKAADK